MAQPDARSDPSVRLAALVGSLRARSWNRTVLEAARELLPPGAELIEHPLTDVPLYNADLEAAGPPAPVLALREVVERTDGLVIFTPEYNRSIPAVTKNAIDWLSRVLGDSPLSRTTVGVVAATPGRHECEGVRGHLADSLARISGRYYEVSVGIGSMAGKVEDGRLADPEARAQLATWLAGFVGYVDRHRGGFGEEASTGG